MLFQRLYNWIKYKTLPTSFFARNRLYIERDTKQRRIYTILGTLFRNSKWGNFELSNIKHQFRYNYLKFLAWSGFFLFAIFLSTTAKTYFNLTYFGGSVNFSTWLIIDALDYYSSFGLWIIIFLCHLSLNWVYSYFFNEPLFLYSREKLITEDLFYPFTKTDEIISSYNSFSIHQSKYLFYYWLTSSSDTNKFKYFDVLFDTTANVDIWKQYHIFFTKLFKATYFCNLTQEFYSLNYLSYSLNSVYPSCFKSLIHSLLINSDHLKELNTYSNVFFWYLLSHYPSYFYFANKTSPSLNIISTSSNWNISQTYLESNKYAFLTNSIIDQFYFTSLTFNKIFSFLTNWPELWSFDDFIKNQTNISKWNRWLYKYSILHRRFLKNSHKLTIAKRFIQSGFYTNTLMNKNTWAAHRARKINKHLLTNLGSLYYLNLFSLNTLNLWNLFSMSSIQFAPQTKKIIFFSNYENSYFWINKRFYFFNTIPVNLIKSYFFRRNKYFINTASLSEDTFSHFFFLSKLASLHSINTEEFRFLNDAMFLFNINVNNSARQTRSYNNKDYYLSFDEDDFFNSEILDISYWITSNNSNKFFSYVILNKDFSNFLVEFKNFSFYNTCFTVNIKQLFDADFICSKDLFFFSFLK